MKLHIYIIGVLLALTSTVMAQEHRAAALALADNEGLLGYTDGANPDSITVSGAAFGTAGTYTIGARLSSDMLAGYVGCKVVGIRFAVSQSIGNTTGYLFKADGGNVESVASKNLRTTAEGWNEIRFSTAQQHEITRGEDLIYCFDYTESAAMAAAGTGAVCAYGTTVTSQFAAICYTGTQFQSLTGIGNLCIQLIVDLTSLPSKHLSATMLLADNKYRQAGQSVDAFLQYANTGKEAVGSCRWGYQIDEGEVSYVDVNKKLTAGSSASLEQLINLPADLTVGHHALKFFTDQIDGTAPARPDTIVDRFIIYQDSLPRQEVYVEQYTSADSYYVPSIDSQIDALDGKNGICLVNVHQSGTDLAVNSASYLENLYVYTWPCFTVNRFYFFGESHIAFDANDYIFILPTLIGQAVEVIASEGKEIPAFASIALSPTYDETTRQLSLNVSGNVSEDAESIFGNLALTVLLAEDGVKSPQLTVNTATGATSVNKNYVHNAVLRAYVSEPLGDRLDVTAGAYQANYTTTLDSQWKPENVKVVAFITKAADAVSDDNVTDMDITNTASVRLSTILNGISQTTCDANTDKPMYNIAGQQVTNAYRGMVIQNGRKFIKK